MQALEPADFPHRVIYCEWLLQECRENPNARQEVRPQQRFSINVCASIINDRLIGPYVPFLL